MQTKQSTPITVEVLQAEDASHVLVAYPWDANEQAIQDGLQQAAMLGYTDMTAEGNLSGHMSQGCDDWDYIRVEPPNA